MTRREIVRRAAVPVWALVLAGLLTWPMARGGYLLGHDLVFTPRQPFGPDAVGLGSAAPRAVPLDALVAIAERIVDGAVVGRVAVLAPLLGAGVGAAAVLRNLGRPAQLIACTVAIWNPYVVERLALGQWALLWTYAVLPWLIVALRWRGGSGRWPARALLLAAGSITPTGGIITAVAAGSLAYADRSGPRRDRWAVAGLALLVQLPWLVPALTASASGTSDPAGVAAFAARAEHPGGVLLSLLAGGGIWDSDVVPGSRDGPLPWIWLVVLAGAAVLGARPLARHLGPRRTTTLAVLAALGLAVAVLPSLPGGAAVARAAVAHVPGAGLLRDAQKWLLPLVLFEALLLGAAGARAVHAVVARPWRILVAVAGVCLPLIVLPDAAATLRPTLRPVHYPADWAAVADRIDGGDALVLPWGSYRTFPWAPGRSVLDPAPRLLPVPAVVDDRLVVGGRVLRGENLRAARVGELLTSGGPLEDPLRRLGIRWVVVEHRTPGPLPDLAGLAPVFDGRDVSLYRVAGTVRAERATAARRAAVVIADVLALAGIIAVVGYGLARALARRRTRRKARRDGPASLL